MLVHHFLEYYARNNPDAPFVTVGGQRKSYAQIESLSNQCSNGLLDRGVSKGDRVAIIGENGLEHILVFFAASKIGAVAVLFNYRLAPAELEYVVGDSGAKVLVVLPGMENTFEAVSDHLAQDLVVFGDTIAGGIGWQDWLASFPATAPGIGGNDSDPFLQLYTSGTTGNPKGVVTSHFNILSLCHMNNAAADQRANAGSCAIICAPLFHIGGVGSLAMGAYAGQHILLHQMFDPLRVLDAMEQYAVASVFMVPAMIAKILQTPNVKQRDLSKLQQINYGASPISETLLRQAWEVFQCEFTQMYGMTETSGTVVSLTAQDHRRALAEQPDLLLSCGRPSVGAAAKIVGPEDDELRPGEVGEIWLKSDGNMLGYHNLPEATASSLTDGWVHTGDAGYMDKEDYIYIKDRIKDMVVSGGENIYPVEVENAISKHEAVLDVAVIGIPDEKYGEALLAFVVIKPEASLGIDELINFCRDKIAGYKIPRKIEVIDEIPRNASGKVLKKLLRAPYWVGRERAVG